MEDRRSCPCCGYLTFEGALASYDICSVCSWEDDAIQEEDPTYSGGANNISLMEAQEVSQILSALQKMFAPLSHVWQ